MSHVNLYSVLQAVLDTIDSENRASPPHSPFPPTDVVIHGSLFNTIPMLHLYVNQHQSQTKL
jgi:hypothetical protein